jgi:putative nucleotidyltransferase with HDIG domain
LWAFLGGFCGGWLSSALSLAIIPLLESLLGYTTDLKLLELARMDHPLLRELVLKAPGTYHHCIIVGSLVEAGCESIGANALLGRVGAYYHDIGKIGRAEYFIENQTSGFNPHEHTKPALSAKIIISHVKEGRALAEKYRLGQSIIDFIEQHHGTSTVSYFYNKAKQEASQPGSNVSPDEVHEEDFQYPGPKPRSREAASMALADSCEAATRSLVDPTPARLQGLVKKIMTKSLNEGLLDEAEITLQEIAVVEQTFLRILLGIHHNRIQYPDQEKGLPPQTGHLNLIKNAK